MERYVTRETYIQIKREDCEATCKYQNIKQVHRKEDNFSRWKKGRGKGGT